MNKTLLFLALLCTNTLFAQLSGTVVDPRGEPVIGASVVLLNQSTPTNIGTVTDFDGNWSINIYGKNAENAVVRIQSMGFQAQDYKTSKPSGNRITLEPDQNVLKEVSVVQQRLSAQQEKSALTVESMDALAIKESPSVSFYDHLGTLKGVDLTSASIGFKIINTRGFNSTSPVRSLQLIDGVDNQSPGLNFSLGNFLGAPDLDIVTVDVIAGASTAFYGPSAFNGVISMQTKDPFQFTGLSASLKAGERNLTEFSMRWAAKVNEKFAYKINVFALKADDWEANNMDPTDISRDDATNPGGYDAVNRYGDEDWWDDGGDSKTFPGLGRFYRPGIEEKHLVDYDTENIKLTTALHYKIKEDLTAIYAVNFGSGTTVYQGDNRYSLKDILFLQNRVELQKKDKWFWRAYSTHEDAGNSYDAYFTALRMQDSVVSNQSYNLYYTGLWNIFNKPKVRAMPGAPANSLPMSQYQSIMDSLIASNPDFFNQLHEDNRSNVSIATASDALGAVTIEELESFANQLIPGTSEFNSLKNHITSTLFTEGGSRFYDKSALYHTQGERTFTYDNGAVFRIGGNFRLYTPKSAGTIFSDTAGTVITNREAGLYGGWEQSFIDERLKLSATGRVDKNQNFRALVSPAVSSVYKATENQTFRLSFSSAIRNPTLADQYLNYNVGRAVLLGNLDGFDSLVTIDNIADYLGKPANERLSHDFGYFNVDAIRPEKVKTAEAGYRATIGSRVFVDANYYYSLYDDFIGYIIGAEIEEGTTAIDRLKSLQVYRVAANANEQVTTQGFSIGMNTFLGNYQTLTGNYSWNKLTSAVSDPIVPAFNTPEHKFNLGWNIRNYPWNQDDSKLIGAGVNYKWVQGFVFEGSPQFTGSIPSYGLCDAQVSLTRIKDNSNKKRTITYKIGASNVLNNKVYQVFGGPLVGRLAYLSIQIN
ncbi:MAG: TonB-dependent receptor [Schleiferiaceae bacterium]|jgi:iron complex outermembrane receptor protein|nr:TonB-dependent receptor [Schleiferiaceae bacterium]MDA9286725.1 TonB-dependent receptor [Schleiferiaceae bacterium]MDC1537283.1 TonB-dependent receptor [Schleiferiaceae bacterium]MDG1656828.1 TonB-dependent receptor [Schleiferiaceae bacterium]